MLNLTKEQVKKLTKDKSVIALSMELSCDTVTPLSVYSLLEEDNSFLLESMEDSTKFGRHTFIGLDPKMILKSKGDQTTLQIGDSISELKGNPIDLLKKQFREYEPINYKNFEHFCGGAVGYLSFEAIQYVEKINTNIKDELETPDLYYIFPKTVLVFDHYKHKLSIIYNLYIDDCTQTSDLYDSASKIISELSNKLHESPRDQLFPLNVPNHDPEFSSNMQKEEYKDIVNKAKNYIYQGEAIQIVLSQRFQMSYKGSALNLYRALRMINPSPYLFLINCNGFHLIGSSPEILVKEEQKNVTIRPIAGTRKRGKSEKEDLFLEKDLLADKKELAEHIMLVDLARNDIGRVCEKGSIQADQLKIIERYSHVMHIVSNVIGKLKADKDAFDLLKACFPAGTVSGAPKIRAMEIIYELEKSQRGPYAGSVCYFDYSGNFDSCITIRTMMKKNDKVFIQAGAGIVYDSVDENEYVETINKAKALMKAVQFAKQIPSMMKDNE